MERAVLTINSRNYGSWSLRGWLLCRYAGLDFEEVVLPSDDEKSRAELLLLSASFQVPRLAVGPVTVWGTLAIAEYLNETYPSAGLLPSGPVERAWCRSVCDEMHSGFANLRAAMPMNIKSRHPAFKVWSGAQNDIDRIVEIWSACLEASGGPYLFGQPTMADAMYAPVCTRFVTYDTELDDQCTRYRDFVMGSRPMKEWIAAAEAEPEDLDELDVEF
ncbi:MAG: glutathione S-transferase [Acidimicrobiia bacterium]